MQQTGDTVAADQPVICGQTRICGTQEHLEQDDGDTHSNAAGCAVAVHAGPLLLLGYEAGQGLGCQHKRPIHRCLHCNQPWWALCLADR